jgi:hypothetical protein
MVLAVGVKVLPVVLGAVLVEMYQIMKAEV